MEVKCLEVRDRSTFIPVICIRPVPDNEAQRYLLRRDGYRGDDSETCIILIAAQCRGAATVGGGIYAGATLAAIDAAYDCYDWPANPRTYRVAHAHIAKNWASLADGDVIDVEFILGETRARKVSERVSVEG